MSDKTGARPDKVDTGTRNVDVPTPTPRPDERVNPSSEGGREDAAGGRGPRDTRSRGADEKRDEKPDDDMGARQGTTTKN